jgi:hypothetical protein
MRRLVLGTQVKAQPMTVTSNMQSENIKQHHFIYAMHKHMKYTALV